MARRFAHLIALLAVTVMVLPPEWCCILRGASPSQPASLTSCKTDLSVESPSSTCPGCCSLANRSNPNPTAAAVKTESGSHTFHPEFPASKPPKSDFCPFCATTRGILPDFNGISLDISLVFPFPGWNFSAWPTPEPIVREPIAARISPDRPLWLLHQSFLC